MPNLPTTVILSDAKNPLFFATKYWILRYAQNDGVGNWIVVALKQSINNEIT